MYKCSICKAELEAYTSAFEDDPWIDGRKHKDICHCCMCVPKMYHYDEEKGVLTTYDEMYYKRLCTVEEIMEDGFEKAEATRSLRAVKALIRKRKK